jgi:hypothetical protein
LNFTDDEHRRLQENIASVLPTIVVDDGFDCSECTANHSILINAEKNVFTHVTKAKSSTSSKLGLDASEVHSVSTRPAMRRSGHTNAGQPPGPSQSKSKRGSLEGEDTEWDALFESHILLPQSSQVRRAGHTEGAFHRDSVRANTAQVLMSSPVATALAAQLNMSHMHASLNDNNKDKLEKHAGVLQVSVLKPSKPAHPKPSASPSVKKAAKSDGATFQGHFNQIKNFLQTSIQ